MLEFVVTSDWGFINDEAFAEAIRAGVDKLGDIALAKVQENLSGKILQKKTGDLFNSIKKTSEYSGGVATINVYADPATDKAKALESGGKQWYIISAVHAKALKFVNKDGKTIIAKSVMHPPSKAFHYLQIALDETAEMVDEVIGNAMDVWASK